MPVHYPAWCALIFNCTVKLQTKCLWCSGSTNKHFIQFKVMFAVNVLRWLRWSSGTGTIFFIWDAAHCVYYDTKTVDYNYAFNNKRKFIIWTLLMLWRVYAVYYNLVQWDISLDNLMGFNFCFYYLCFVYTFLNNNMKSLL